MATKICKYCGKEFEGTGTASYCDGPHFAVCAFCGKEFEKDPRSPSKCCSKQCSANLRKSTIYSQTKLCKICGKEFHPSSNTSEYCEGPHYRPCPICGKDVKILYEYEEPRCCSTECTVKLRSKTCNEKYGTEVASKATTVRAKLRAIAMSPDVVNKRKQHSLIKWGVDNPAKNIEIRQKISNTVSSEDCQNRIKQTNLDRYGTEHPMQSEEGMKRYTDSMLEKYGVPYYCMKENTSCISKINKNFSNLLLSLNLNSEFEFSLGNKSFDLHILDTNILIEIDPTYTHNVVGNHWGNGIDRSYHLDKTKLAEEHGYRCIHIFDWEDSNKIVSMLKPKEKVYARKCVLREVDAKTAGIFLDKYHLQGKVRGQKIGYGLYYKGELIQIMNFGTPRYNKNYQWELLRLCTNSNYKVVGGAEKLFKHFIKECRPESIISYCDRSKFSGEVYGRLGFNLLRNTEPNKVWSRGKERITNNFLLQRGYDQIFNANYGKGTSNEELMLQDGWLPVYDCGQAVYEYRCNL